MSAGYRILEHTADIGIESWGDSIEGCFEQAAYGLAEILGAQVDRGRGRAPAHESVRVAASGSDRGALLVDLLNELLLLHETHEIAFGDVTITRMTDTELEAKIEIEPIEGETETTGVKAATYHRLRVGETDGGFEARVYLDV